MKQAMRSRLARLERRKGGKLDIEVVFRSHAELAAEVEELRKRFGFEGFLPESFVHTWHLRQNREGKQEMVFRPPLVAEKPLRTA